MKKHIIIIYTENTKLAMNKTFYALLAVAIFLISTVIVTDASHNVDAVKSEGTANPKFGSDTASKVCGDRLCSEVEVKSTEEMTKHKEHDEKNKHEKQKGKHGEKNVILANQKMAGKYKITLDWIHEFPVSDESNGFEILVSDTSIKSKHGGHEDKGKHGESSHEDKGKHGESSHEDKGKHGESSHEDKGDCRCIKLLKSSNPKAELFENGVKGLENHLTLTIYVSGQKTSLPIIADDLDGRYYALFVPTLTGQYEINLSGTINGVSVNHTFNPDSVLKKSELIHFP